MKHCRGVGENHIISHISHRCQHQRTKKAGQSEPKRVKARVSTFHTARGATGTFVRQSHAREDEANRG